MIATKTKIELPVFPIAIKHTIYKPIPGRHTKTDNSMEL
jgi:hypothetical protein